MIHTLRARIILAFNIVIFSAIIISAILAFISTEYQFEAFVEDINIKQASGLVGVVEVEYNLNGNLDSLTTRLDKLRNRTLARHTIGEYDTSMWYHNTHEHGVEGDLAVSALMRIESEKMNAERNFPNLLYRWYQAQHYVFGHSESRSISYDQTAFYKLNTNFSIRYNNHEAEENESHEKEHVEENHADNTHHLSLPFYHWQSGSIVGYIVSESGAEYNEESGKFIKAMLSNSLYGGLISAFLAFALGIWLARRINAPVKDLTKAATQIANSGEPSKLPIYADDELGQMGKAFNQMADSIQNQREIRKQLIANISHELNTPLSIMRLEAQGMVNGMQSAPVAAKNIQREIDLLHGLINDLELIAEVEKKTIRLHKKQVVMSEFIEEVLQRWRSKAESQQVTMHVINETTEPFYIFDANRMRQVLSNLLRNALQHINENGLITLKVFSPRENTLIFEVIDTGRGISEAFIPYLFDRFAREEKGVESRGRGLGLAIVKQLTELHGGSVKVQSVVGKGSTFTVTIPVIQNI